MDEADRQRACGVEALRREEERAGVALADLADGEGRDDRWRDAQPRLGEAEAGVIGGDGDVADGGEAGATAKRRAVNATNDGMAAGIYHAEHIGHTQRVGDVLSRG